MAEEPSISVVVPMFNEAVKIDCCLKALAEQALLPFEVIVVDNNSSDASSEVVIQAISRYQKLNLVLVSESKPGPAAARNKGIEQARGSVIAFTDADCVPDKQWIRQISLAFVKDKELDAIGGIERPFSMHSTIVHRVLSSTWLPPNERLQTSIIISKDDWLVGKFISTFNCALTRVCLDDIGGFDEAFFPAGEDMDLWFRAIEQGAKILAWHSEIVVEHHQAISLRALLRKMFFYGEALAHLTRQHFGGRFFVLSRWFGATEVPLFGVTGIIWNHALMSLPALLVLVVIGALSWALIAPTLLIFLVLLMWKLRRGILAKGFCITTAELPVALAVYCLRTVSREIGLCYGSIRHRVVSM